MSEIKRKGLEFALNQIGKALYAYENLVGDTYTPNTFLYDLENNLIKLRGSKIFNDYDLSKKDPYTDNIAELNTFDSLDTANFVIQGGDLSIKDSISSFANTGTWNPSSYSPICPEGWGIYDYNAWSNYIPLYDSSGAANTSYIIYNPLSEPGSGTSRPDFDYPIRYSGYGFTYERVPLFNHASWISVYNDERSGLEEIEFVIEKRYFDGCMDINPLVNAPNDIIFYSHANLFSTTLTDPITLSGTMGTLGISDVLVPLPHKIVECDISGSTDVYLFKNHYKVNVQLPSATTFDVNKYFHFIAYWGSQDSYIQEIKPNYLASNNLLSNLFFEAESLNRIHPRKNFFIKTLKSSIEFTKSGIFDTNVYLFNNNNLLITNKETKYNEQKSPFRYKINESISGSSSGQTNSLLGFSTLNIYEYLPIVIAIKNSGNYYDQPEINLELFYDSKIIESDIPEKWENFISWPTIPDEYDIVSKIVCKYSKTNYNLTLNSNIINDLDIIYIENLPDNVIKKGVSDVQLSQYFTQPLFYSTNSIRNSDYSKNFNYLGQRILTYGVNITPIQIQAFSQFADFNTNQYLVLHNLLKLPKNDNLLNVDTYEPIAIQFENPSSNLISKFGSIPPTTNIAGFSGSSLYLDKFTFKTGSEFEIYYEKNQDEIENHANDNANGLENDYTFRLKFLTVDNQYLIKDVYVNASKYFLSQNEYNERLNKKLSVDGYFTASNISEIEDFRKYSYSGLIPDLKMGEFKTIQNKQNSPTDSNRLTEEEYENILKENNPSITKDEIIVAKVGFGLTDSFYIVDTSSPNNSNKELKEVGITISKYDDIKNLKWTDNVSHLYGATIQNNIEKPLNLKDLRYDSFIIANSGFNTTDNSINELENFGNQQVISNTISSINQLNQLSTQTIPNEKLAVRVSCDITQEIKGFKVKLKSTSPYINSNSTIRAEIYSDKNNLPNELLRIGSEIKLNSINQNLEDKYFYIDYKFFKNRIYWIVLNISQMPPIYDPIITGLANVGNTSVTGIYNPKTNSYTNFDKYLLGSEIGFGSSSGTSITSWYPITSIGSSTDLIFSGNGFTNTKLDYSVKFNFAIGIGESSAIGASTNLSSFGSSEWSSLNGTAFIKFFKPEIDIYGSFNKNYVESNGILPPSNTYREMNDYIVSEFYSFNNKPINPTSLLSIYPRSIYLNNFEFTGTGTSTANYINVSKENWKDSILIGIGISQSEYFTSGTSITNIVYDNNTELYKLYLSTNILKDFTELSVGTATSEHFLIKRSSDINLILKYDTESGSATTTITLHKSPTWTTKWFNKTKNKFNLLEKNIKPDLVSSTYNLNFINKKINDQSEYINGYSILEAYPLASLGTTFDFKFESSNGVRVYINDNENPSLDNWLNLSSIGNTFSKTLSSVSEKIKFEVEFNHNSTTASTGATIIGYWKKQNESSWNFIDDTFYIDNYLDILQIDPLLIHKINFMNVSDSISDFDNNTLGSPPNDKIVIRSV